MLFTLPLAAAVDPAATPLHSASLLSGAVAATGLAAAVMGRAITLSIEFSRVLRMLPVVLPDVLSPPRCGFFFLAKSYMSPNMPANVLRRFFIVSSASSTFPGAPWPGPGPTLLAFERAAEADETPEMELD